MGLSGKPADVLARGADALQRKASYIVSSNGEDFTHTQLVNTVAELHDLCAVYVQTIIGLQKLLAEKAKQTEPAPDVPQHEHLKDEHAAEHVEGERAQEDQDGSE